MANQYYTIIDTLLLELDGKTFEVIEWECNLEEFLKNNSGKQLYIYGPSMTSNKIKAIVK